MKKELQEALEKISKLEELLKQKDERIVFFKKSTPIFELVPPEVAIRKELQF